MHAKKIIKIDLLDILFEGRNKEYGAYDLRKTYNKRLLIALIGTVVVISGLFIGSVIKDRMAERDLVTVMQVKDVSLEAVKPNEPPPPPPPPPPRFSPPPQVATIAFTPPKVVKDEEVIKPPPEVRQIEEARVDVKTVEGTKDLGIIAPPVTEKGTQVAAAPTESKKDDDDKVFLKVEIDASFPGGTAEWTRYVQKAIQANQDEFTDSDFGQCLVKFIVDKKGVVSAVEATTMKGSKLAEVATNIIRKGPNWIPARQNGRNVNAYRIQPVSFINAN
ncbi:MAG: energy transducer TonB [Ginsengibacter sp.]